MKLYQRRAVVPSSKLARMNLLKGRNGKFVYISESYDRMHS